MAGRTPLLKVRGDVSEARAAVRQLKDDARDFGRIKEDARLDVKTEGAEAKLEQLHARLEKLSKQEPTVTVKVRMARTIEQIERLEAKLAELGRKDVTVDVKIRRHADLGATAASGAAGILGDVPLVGGLLGGAASGIASLASAAGAGAGSLTALLPVVGESAAGIVALGTSALVAVPLMLALAAAVTTVIGVLVALVASLAAAVAGAAVLAVAFGVALIGPIGIAVAAFAKLTTIFKAFETQEKGHLQTSAALSAAADQERQANAQLAQAYENLQQQTIAARQAQQDATEAVKDDILARKDAILGIADSRLGLREAEQALKDFRAQVGATGSNDLFKKLTDVNFKGSLKGALSHAGAAAGLSPDDELRLERLILDVRRAKLAEQHATDGLHDSNVKLSRDRQTEADFLQHGLSAYPGYAAALRQVASAQDAVHRATLASTKAEQAQSKGLETLNPAERRLARTLGGIKDSLEETFSPAIDRALGGIVTLIGDLAKVASSPAVRRALKGIGDALHAAFVRVGNFLSDPASIGAITAFLNAGRRLVGPLTTLFITFAKVVRDLARDALPAVIRGVKTFAAQVSTWEKHHGGAKKLQGTVSGLIDSFNAWVKIGKGLSLIILAFLRGAKGTGDSFAGTLGDVLVKWGRFLNTKKGQQGIITFFHDVKTIVHDLVILLDHMVRALGKVPAAVKAIKSAVTVGSGSHASIPSQILGGIKNQILNNIFKAQGGVVPGPSHPIDSVIAHLTGGEYVIRRAIVQALGVPALDALNAGVPMTALAGAGAGGGSPAVQHVTNHNHFHLHTPGGGSPEPMTAGAQIEGELRRRGLA